MSSGDVSETDEYAESNWEDSRLDERLRRAVTLIASNPGQSFPEQMVNDADQEGLYRFLKNPKVTVDILLQGHRAQTLDERQVSGADPPRRSEFVFKGERDGMMPPVQKEAKGFSGHFALAVAGDESREALGVLGLFPILPEASVKGLTTNRSWRSRCGRRAQKEVDSMGGPGN